MKWKYFGYESAQWVNLWIEQVNEMTFWILIVWSYMYLLLWFSYLEYEQQLFPNVAKFDSSVL